MNNFFDGVTVKEIPKSLEECYRQDHISKGLSIFGSGIEKISRIVCMVIGILGFILALSLEKLGLFLPIAIITAITTFTIALICTFIALVVLALASIEQNNSITANIMLYNAANKNTQQEQPVFNGTETEGLKMSDTAELLHKKDIFDDKHKVMKTQTTVGDENDENIQSLQKLLEKNIIDKATFEQKKAEIISTSKEKAKAIEKCSDFKDMLEGGLISHEEYIAKCKSVMGEDFVPLELYINEAMKLSTSTEIYDYINNKCTLEDSYDMKLLLKKLQSQANRERTYGNTKTETCDMLEGFMKNGNMFARIDKNAEGDIICPICGERQPAYMSKCRSCKVPFAGFNE